VPNSDLSILFEWLGFYKKINGSALFLSVGQEAKTEQNNSKQDKNIKDDNKEEGSKNYFA